MNKQKILELTGLNEDDFYDQYPDQESFCQDYPEACAQLNQPYDVISPIVSKYETPNGVMNKTPNEFAIKPMSPKQTMYNVGSIGTSYSIPIYPSDEMKHGGGIHINPANKGKFTAWAQAHGMGVQEAARHVMANKEDYSPTIVKRANFARNFGGNKKEEGGDVMVPEYKTGGHWIQGAVKHPGRCTPGSPNYDCPKGSPQWNLAQTFKKHHGFHEEGGDVFPAMRTMFKHGGYYGMDGRFHKNTDSGTYVGGAGYYFQGGGANINYQTGSASYNPSADAAGTGAVKGAADAVAASSSSWSANPDGGYNVSQPNYEFSSDGQPYIPDEEEKDKFDDSPYKSEIDADTGFTTWSKNNKVIRNIKKDDPALWEHLKEEGHGARWATGQTDIQKFGRTAGKIGQGLESAVNVAGAIGGFLNARQQRKNLDKAAINMGSTASMYSNPQGSSRGDYGATGSYYGMFKPNQSGNYSFKGMYGKYGMQVPKYAVGGFEPQLDVLSDYGLSGPEQNIPVPIVQSDINYKELYSLPSIPSDNTRVALPRVPLEVRESENNAGYSDDNLKSLISEKESGGNYKALPWLDKKHTKLASSAAGKYQFLWDKHKPDIQKITGVKTKEEFLNNPKAQETYFDYWNDTTLTPLANKIKTELKLNIPINKIKAAIHFSGPKGALDYFSKGKIIKDAFGSTQLSYMSSFKNGGQQLGGQVVEMDEDQIQQFLAAGGQLEFLD